MRTESLGRSYLALPDGPAPYPGVVVVHEASGLNDNIRDICGRFAAEGYAALGVDLFEGRNRAACMARMFVGGMAGNLDYYGVPALKDALGQLASASRGRRRADRRHRFLPGRFDRLDLGLHRRPAGAPSPRSTAPRPGRGRRSAACARSSGSWPGKDFTTKAAGVLEAEPDGRRDPARPEGLPGGQALLLQRPVARLPPRRGGGLLAAGPGLFRRACPGQPGSSS